MRALSIRQPFAEAILCGLKTIEYRTIATRVIGERFYIYASSQPGAAGRFKKLDNQIDKLRATTETPSTPEEEAAARVVQPVLTLSCPPDSSSPASSACPRDSPPDPACRRPPDRH